MQTVGGVMQAKVLWRLALDINIVLCIFLYKQLVVVNIFIGVKLL